MWAWGLDVGARSGSEGGGMARANGLGHGYARSEIRDTNIIGATFLSDFAWA